MSDGRRRIENLEIHVSHACNLTCESCSHYSNHGHRGRVSRDEAEAWMEGWHERLVPDLFSLLGGEPTIHPELPELVEAAARLWPDSTIRVVTNGFLLHRHPRLPAVLPRDRSYLQVSVHSTEPEYLDRLRPVERLLDEWKRDFGACVVWRESYRNWTRRYHGWGAEMRPYDDGRPRESWEHCPAKYCMQLHQGKLWKCAPLAYLRMQVEAFDLGEDWRRYLTYRPLPPDSTDAQLDAFLAREEEPQCNMCPAEPRAFRKPSPLIPVSALRRRAAALSQERAG